MGGNLPTCSQPKLLLIILPINLYVCTNAHKSGQSVKGRLIFSKKDI
jgi:hypothetical protein